MTKEQRTSLNILIDLAIRKGYNFQVKKEGISNTLTIELPEMIGVRYYFSGAGYGYSDNVYTLNFKQAVQTLNKY